MHHFAMHQEHNAWKTHADDDWKLFYRNTEIGMTARKIPFVDN